MKDTDVAEVMLILGPCDCSVLDNAPEISPREERNGKLNFFLRPRNEEEYFFFYVLLCTFSELM